MGGGRRDEGIGEESGGKGGGREIRGRRGVEMYSERSNRLSLEEWYDAYPISFPFSEKEKRTGGYGMFISIKESLTINWSVSIHVLYIMQEYARRMQQEERPTERSQDLVRRQRRT